MRGSTPAKTAQEILSRPEEQIPHYLFGKNPFLREFADKNRMPLLAALGGAQTLHPEFEVRLKDTAAAEAEAMAKIVPARGPQQSSHAVDPDPKDGEIHVLTVQGNVYMLVGDGGNIAVEVGDQGALLVDSGAGKLSDKVVAAVSKLSRNPIQFIVNTSFHPDHTGGNAKIAAAGVDPSLPGSFFGDKRHRGNRVFPRSGSSRDADRPEQYSGPNGDANLPNEMIPPDTYLEKRRKKYHNGELVEIFYQPNAITDGDSIVQFRRSDVIATGDIYDTTRYPFIDEERRHGPR